MVVTLSGDVISHADINLKLPRPAAGKDLYSNTTIREDAPWQLQQVQDSVNHLRFVHLLKARNHKKCREYIQLVSK